MAIKFRCVCGRILAVADKFAGKKGKCPSCNRLLLIPTPQSTPDSKPTLEESAPKPAPQEEAIAAQAGDIPGEDEPRRGRRESRRGDRKDRGDRAGLRSRRSERHQPETDETEQPVEQELEQTTLDQPEAVPEPEPPEETQPEPEKEVVAEPTEEEIAAAEAQRQEDNNFFASLDGDLNTEPEEPAEAPAEETGVEEPAESAEPEEATEEPHAEEMPEEEKEETPEEEEEETPAEEPAETTEEEKEESATEEPTEVPTEEEITDLAAFAVESKEGASEEEAAPASTPGLSLSAENLLENLPDPMLFDEQVAQWRETLPEEDHPALLEEFQSVNERYEICAPIAHDEMFVDYAAIDSQNPDDLVTLKAIRPSVVGNPALEEFLTEEGHSFLFGLKPANAQTCSDFGSTEQFKYLVCDLLPGRSLKEIINHFQSEEKPIPLNNAITIVKDVLVLLGSLGTEETPTPFHADIRPGNIYVSEDGSAKVTGIGLTETKLKGGLIQLSRDRLPYVAPEQHLPDSSPDIAGDIFATGALLYTLLAGKPPIGMIKPPSAIRDGLPEELDGVVERAMSADLEERYQTPQEMLAALRIVEEKIAATLSAEGAESTGPDEDIDADVIDLEPFAVEEETASRRQRGASKRGDLSDRKRSREGVSEEKKKRNLMINLVMIVVIILCVAGLVYIFMTRFGKNKKKKGGQQPSKQIEQNNSP